MDNPVNLRNVQSSGSHISAQQYSRLRITELEKCCSTFGLFLLALKRNKHTGDEIATKNIMRHPSKSWSCTDQAGPFCSEETKKKINDTGLQEVVRMYLSPKTLKTT